MNFTLTLTAYRANADRLSGGSDPLWGIGAAGVADKDSFRGGYSGLRQSEKINNNFEGDNLSATEGHPQQQSGRHRLITVP